MSSEPYNKPPIPYVDSERVSYDVFRMLGPNSGLVLRHGAVFSVDVTSVEFFSPIRMSGWYKSARYDKPSKTITRILLRFLCGFLHIIFSLLPPKCLTESQKQTYNLNRSFGLKTCNCIVENVDGEKYTDNQIMCNVGLRCS